MDILHEPVFDFISDVLEKIGKKLQEDRPVEAKNGTLAEWIVFVCSWGVMIAELVWICGIGRGSGDTFHYYAGIILLVFSVVLVIAVLLRRMIRKLKSRRDSEESM